jgi:hypothetical protein
MCPERVQLQFARWVPGEAVGKIEELFGLLQCENCGTSKQPPLPEHRTQCAFLLRLANDPEMQSVYRALQEEFGEGSQWGPLVEAAVMALRPFKEQRDDLKRARELREQFIERSKALRRAGSALLDLRLGRKGRSPSDMNWPPRLAPKIRRLEEETAALEQELSDWKPVLLDTDRAATAARTSNKGTEYIRAFWHELQFLQAPGRRQFARTPGLLNALATIATVALEDADKVATYDTVAKVLRSSSRKKS